MVRRFRQWWAGMVERHVVADAPSDLVLRDIHVAGIKVDFAEQDGFAFVWVNGRLIGGFQTLDMAGVAITCAVERARQQRHALTVTRPAA